MLLPAIVKSVPSPSIFSPSLPNVNPTFAGMLISVVAVKLISAPAAKVKSVPSDEMDSFASCNCSVGVPPLSVNNNPVSAT